MTWWKQFKPSACIVKLKGASKEDVLAELVDNLVKAKALDEGLAEAASKALLEREALASTGVGMGVAIPHIKLPGLERVACSLAVHAEGLEWARAAEALLARELKDPGDPDRSRAKRRVAAHLHAMARHAEALELLDELAAELHADDRQGRAELQGARTGVLARLGRT